MKKPVETARIGYESGAVRPPSARNCSGPDSRWRFCCSRYPGQAQPTLLVDGLHHAIRPPVPCRVSANGDLITEFNGVSITSPTESAQLLQEFNDSSSVALVVENADGEVRTINVDLDE